MKALFKLALAGALAVSLTACASSQGPNQTGGTVVGAGAGALAGGLIGGAIGGRGGAIAGVVSGGVLGGLAGNAIGRDMDERDRAAAIDAQYVAFESGKRRTWKGRNAYGYVDPGPEYVDTRGTCRNYTQRIYIDGRPQAAQGVACRNPDGTWAPVS